jgi:hypothetical protein
MVVNRDFTAPVEARVVLKQPVAAVLEVSKATGETVPMGGYHAESGTLNMPLAPGDGRLLRLR